MESINRPKLVKEHNLNLVRQQLYEARFATRQQLSALTGISNVTMGSLLNQMLETGEALETERLPSAGGRPAAVYSYNAHREYALLLSVGFEKTEYRFRSVLTDLYGRPVWEEERPIAHLDHRETLEYLERLTHIRQPVGAVGIGLPGIGFGEYLRRGGHAEYLSLTALEEFQQASGIPIRVENDVNLAAMGYAKLHRIDKTVGLAYLYLMKGIYGGSAIFLDGKLHLGKGRFAGELLPVPYGVDWSRMKAEPAEALEDALFVSLLPYLTILAPHHVVIASDYIREEHLRQVERRLTDLLEAQNCPQFALAEDFRQDYQKGLEQLALEQLPFPIGTT